MRALLVDDEVDICEIIDFKLQLLGFECDYAHTGNDAIEKCKNNNYELIISDIRMPAGSGMDLVIYLNKNAKTLPVIIFLTGYTDISENKVLNHGVVEIIDKPIDFDKLLGCIKKHLL